MDNEEDVKSDEHYESETSKLLEGVILYLSAPLAENVLKAYRGELASDELDVLLPEEISLILRLKILANHLAL